RRVVCRDEGERGWVQPGPPREPRGGDRSGKALSARQMGLGRAARGHIFRPHVSGCRVLRTGSRDGGSGPTADYSGRGGLSVANYVDGLSPSGHRHLSPHRAALDDLAWVQHAITSKKSHASPLRRSCRWLSMTVASRTLLGGATADSGAADGPGSGSDRPPAGRRGAT